MPRVRVGGNVAKSQRVCGGVGIIQAILFAAGNVWKVRRAGALWDELNRKRAYFPISSLLFAAALIASRVI